MSDIELIEDAYGSLHPVKTSDLHEYGMDADKSFAGWPSVKAVRKSISSAELLAIHDAPVVIVPASGPGTINLLVGYVSRFHHGETAYETVTALGIYYRDYDNEKISQEIIEIANPGSEVNLMYYYYIHDNSSMLYVDVENKDIVLDASVNPESGDGTLDFVAFYITVEI